MSEEDQNRRRLERAGWAAVGDFSLSLLLLLKKGLFLREVAFPVGPLWASRSSTQFEADGVVSGGSGCGLRG